MNYLISPSWIIPFDFYDELIVKYYGKMYEYYDIDDDSGAVVKVVAYIWNDKWYISKVDAIN